MMATKRGLSWTREAAGWAHFPAHLLCDLPLGLCLRPNTVNGVGTEKLQAPSCHSGTLDSSLCIPVGAGRLFSLDLR